jgi:hypothetical protein
MSRHLAAAAAQDQIGAEKARILVEIIDTGGQRSIGNKPRR